MTFSSGNSLTIIDETIPAKYAVVLTRRGWEIFEDRKPWNVFYPTFFEAYTTLKAIHEILTKINKMVHLTKNI